MQTLTRKPFADILALGVELQARINRMMDSDGLCACGRYLGSLDRKFILVNPIPSKGQMVVAAYCFQCFLRIDDALKACQGATYKQYPKGGGEADLRG